MVDQPDKRFPARFFESANGTVPVRDWLLSLCRSLANRPGLWEVRSRLPGGRIARVFFCAHEGHMVLLHGFEKKTRKTPDHDIDVAVKRMKGLAT
ncbi:MAG: hypothetical protein CMP81_10265 [Fulvimarina sp.]|nr:hypothetical protein [Fulvimarina sp.]